MKYFVTAALILFGTTTALWSLWSSSYLPAFHDQYQAERIHEMSRAIAFGQIPPRYVENIGYGYGYPLFNFYGPLPYYVGSIFFLLGLDIILATKLMISFGFMLAFLTMYWCGTRLWGREEGVLSAVLYTFAPYHAVQLYVRGSIGELYAYAFLPLVVTGMLELFKKNTSRTILYWSICGTALLYISHTISMYMTLLALVPVALLQWKKLRTKLVIFFILPLLLTCYYWLPAFSELHFTRLNTQTGNDVDYRDHFITISQLWNSAWGYGGSTSGTEGDGLSFMIGKPIIVLTIGIILWALYTKFIRKNSLIHTNDGQKILSLTVVILLCIFLTVSASIFIWQTIPMMSLIQFPWRFLMFIVFAMSLLAGYSITIIKKYTRTLQVAPYFHINIPNVLILVVTWQLLYASNFSHIKFFRAEQFYTKNSQDIIDTMHLQGEVSQVSNEFLYRNVPLPAKNEYNVTAASCTMPCSIRSENFTPDRFEVTVQALSEGVFTISKANFPGFNAYIDNVRVPIEEQQGFMSVAIPKRGTYTVVYQLHDTPIRVFANSVTVITILGIAIFWIIVKKPLKVVFAKKKQ